MLRTVTVQLLVAGELIVLASCRGGDALGGRAAFEVRDSLGIEIVESFRPTWRESERWRLGEAPLFIIPGGGERGQLLDPTSIDVDPRGRIIVGDGDQFGWDAILVYDSEGNFLFQAGRPGSGPGEFGQLWWASSYRGDSIAGFDMSGDEVAIFDPDGRFVREVRTPQLPGGRPPPGTYGFTNGVDAAFGDGHFLAYPRGILNIEAGPGPAWYEHTLLRLHPDGEAWDTLGKFEIGLQYWTGQSQESLWFAPYAIKVVGENELYYGRGDRFEIEVYGPAGTLDRLIRRAHDPVPVTEELKEQLKQWYLERATSSPEGGEAVIERMRERFETGQYAQALPAYSHMIMDGQGYLWVEEFRWLGIARSPLDRPAQWSVFDTSGVWLGDVDTPPGFIMLEVTDNRALGLVIDDMDAKSLYAYELRRSTHG